MLTVLFIMLMMICNPLRKLLRITSIGEATWIWVWLVHLQTSRVQMTEGRSDKESS